MEDKIVYFACNNWHPSPKEADRLIYEHLEKDVEVKESVEYFEYLIKHSTLEGLERELDLKRTLIYHFH